jgi:molybdopterin/thiamine biosynthesis adenylyltransferase
VAHQKSDPIVQTYHAPPLPDLPDREDPFDRQEKVPGHDQNALDCHVVLAGAGALGGWIAMGLARSGVTRITATDPDRVEITNLPRQLFYPGDIGHLKGPCLAKNLVPHCTSRAVLTGIGMPFQDAIKAFALPCDLLVVGVDNNPARLAAVRFARRRGIPAVFVAFTLDGMRVSAFLQGPRPEDPCWHCAQPDIDPERYVACAAAIISTCHLAAGVGVFLSHRALMGWPDGVTPYNWREVDLLGLAPDKIGTVSRRADCPTCGAGR